MYSLIITVGILSALALPIGVLYALRNAKLNGCVMTIIWFVVFIFIQFLTWSIAEPFTPKHVKERQAMDAREQARKDEERAKENMNKAMSENNATEALYWNQQAKESHDRANKK